MHRIQEHLAFAKAHGLFKSASAHEVISSLLPDILRPMRRHCTGGASTSRVDFFISHSWACRDFLKLLAVCHHLNFYVAFASSVIASLSAAVILVLYAGSFTRVAQMDYSLVCICMVCCPLGVFVLTYLFGHTACANKSFWFDRVCVPQDNALASVQTLRTIPAFIAQSTQMLVLWDISIFERLWCNYELAVHIKTSRSDALKFVPIWEPIGTMIWLGIWSLTVFSISSRPELPDIDQDSEMSMLASYWITYFPSTVFTLVISVPCSWLCLQKFHRHKLMLDQMSSFDIRNAKCTLETDRMTIMDHVVDLFDEALEPPISVAFGEDLVLQDAADVDIPLVSPTVIQEIRHVTSYPTKDEILDVFNAYVRGSLRDAVLRSTGKEDYFSLTLCSVSSLPFLLRGLAMIFLCDGQGDCQKSVSQWGYPSFISYMLGSALLNLLVVPWFAFTICPLMLRATSLMARAIPDEQGHNILRMMLSSLLCAGLLFLWINLCVAECAMVLVTFAKSSAICFAGFTAGLLLLLWVHWILFRQRTETHKRSLQLA